MRFSFSFILLLSLTKPGLGVLSFINFGFRILLFLVYSFSLLILIKSDRFS